MKYMKVWFPDFFTEAHRHPGEGDVLVDNLTLFGIECVKELTDDCSFIFCGTIWKLWEVKEGQQQYPHIPVIHYNWDLYPFQIVENENYQRANPDLWIPYLTELANCRDIWVPSQCVVDRTKEFTKRSDSVIIKTSVRPWDYPQPVSGDYVVDVMRRYPDPNLELSKEGCTALGIPLIRTRNEVPWEDFKTNIAEARLLISAHYEASTGGLTLLEGYWHGKPVMLPNSPRHGGVDYFGNRATYFQWDNPLLFRNALLSMYNDPPKINIDEARSWIQAEYSEYAMASRMAKRFWELYDESR